MNNENYKIIIDKLDIFIRKFYKNLLIKGIILTITFLLSYFLFISVLEYFSYFSSILRTFLFYSFLLFGFLSFFYFIIIPSLKLYKLGRVISYKQCSDILTVHFPEIKDKLINVIELQNNLKQNHLNRDLIIASINQKSDSLRFIKFTKAIDISKNVKYLKTLILPILVLLFIFLTSPALITESSNRIIHYKSFYEKPNPFNFDILNDKLEAIQNEDFKLDIKIIGEKIPEKVFIKIGNSIFPLEKHSKISYSYLFKQINNSVIFQLLADNFQTKPYTIVLIKKPIIINFDIMLNYPKYIGKIDEKLSNIGDLIVPEGTHITWLFKTLNTKQILFSFNDNSSKKTTTLKDNFIYSNYFFESSFYSIIPQNDNIKNKDSLNYQINIIKDQYPQIEISQYQDSVYKLAYYIYGKIKDDYGFNKLIFNYKFLNTSESIVTPKSIVIPITKNKTSDIFNYFIDFSILNFKPGDKIEYFFEIYDNDEINGSKSTKSTINNIEVPTLDQVNKILDNNKNDIKNLLNEKINELNEIDSKIEKFNKRVLEKEKLTWSEKNELNQFMEQQNKIKSDIELLNEKNNENINLENQFNESDQDMLEKQKKLQELFDQVLNEDTKKLFDELQKLMEKIDKNKIQELIDKMKMSNQDVKDQLDRNLELFKQLEFDYKLEKIINQIESLKNMQDSLIKETNNSSKNNFSKLVKEQDNIKKDFENLSKELKKLDTLNKQLEQPKELYNSNQNEENIKNNLKNSVNNLKNSDKKNAIKSQKQVSQELDDLENKLSEMNDKLDQEQNEEDITNLRQILENLIQISFTQEDLIKNTKIINSNDPKFVSLMQNQKKIVDNLKLVEDSLFALSKRQMQIEPIVNKEINKINYSEKNILEFFKQKNISNILINQQLAMTSINNLALLLAESLEQIKNQNNQNQNSKANKKGNTCKKPGSGKPNLESLRKLQQQLNKEIQDLKEGNLPMSEKNQVNEKLAKLAAQQQFLRNQLQQIQNQLQIEGNEIDSKEIKKINEMMEQSETELINKTLSKQLIERQKEIEIRLLESEKSQKEKDIENKRQSNEAKNLYFSNKFQKLEYNRNKQNEKEIFKTNNPQYQFFYKSKIYEYFNKFNQ